ncbi:MAG: methylmalonyl-CoA decarboxylase, partial [Paraburkholderia nemoris]
MNTPNASPFTVTVDIVDERIARLTFSHPTRRNALSADLLHALDSNLVDLAAQRIPVVILGSGIG